MGVGKYISSDTFFVGGHLWQIQFNPDGKNNVEIGDIYVSLYVALVSKCEGGVETYCEYILFDQIGNKWTMGRDGKFTTGSTMIGPHTIKEGRMRPGTEDPRQAVAWDRRSQAGGGLGIGVGGRGGEVVGGALVANSNPDGKKKYESGGDSNVSLYIALVSKKCEEDIRVWLLFVLLDESGNKWQRFDGFFKMEPKDTRCLPGPYAIHDSKRTIGYEYFCKRTELEPSQFIKDDCLTIQCNVGVVKTSMYNPKTLVQLSDLRQSYKQLLESREGSDVSFEVEGETFYAHKIILSTMSPVLNAQFFGPLKEENTQCIKIEEMQAPVFKALLHFIYCDVIPDFDSKCGATIMTQHLLAAADRYGIHTLRSLCELRLCENIDINSVVSSLALAEQHGCFQLKSRCLEFIGRPKNLEAVIQTDGFKNLKESCPTVTYDLLISVARLRDYSSVSYGPGDTN
ncbi:hypothetical protein RD792_017263 [Penstemon davidsonii]|uniref:BTB domain-containing protein n=1 Tax=Penstemon davidsonii TaxID=160366 RepID=A0ABR0CNX6_9LAMI|nr:hypothetical protein RD792_017263 [Penstemon davidsonii]